MASGPAARRDGGVDANGSRTEPPLRPPDSRFALGRGDKPWAGMPHARKASNSALAPCGQFAGQKPDALQHRIRAAHSRRNARARPTPAPTRQAVVDAVSVHDKSAPGADQHRRRSGQAQLCAQAKNLRANTRASHCPAPGACVCRSCDLPAPGTRPVGVHAQRGPRVHRHRGPAALDPSRLRDGCRTDRLTCAAGPRSSLGGQVRPQLGRVITRGSLPQGEASAIPAFLAGRPLEFKPFQVRPCCAALLHGPRLRRVGASRRNHSGTILASSRFNPLANLQVSCFQMAQALSLRETR
jgi:hypothetical protein